MKNIEELTKEALQEYNEESERTFKEKVKDHLDSVASHQRSIQALRKQIADKEELIIAKRKSLKELTLQDEMEL